MIIVIVAITPKASGANSRARIILVIGLTILEKSSVNVDHLAALINLLFKLLSFMYNRS
ncbi:hypothetical protein SDC9_125358 [bioreactor metagenome]|uniref:Uncharacterized protein n=1 Tax=bioreactor metagenome TaxID=1076179 RepID=A0A645CN55_9ZZZZ